MLNQRLQQIADYIDDNSYVLDVGCDHALLDIYLVKYKKNVHAIASDISKNALDYAKANIEKYQVTSLVKLSLGNGLETITKEVDTVVISGMGALTMIDILKKGQDKMKQVKHFILSPNVDVELVREYMVKEGFYILKENLIYENGKYYSIIAFERGNKKYSDVELYFGPHLLEEKSEIFMQKLKTEKENIEKILEGIADLKKREVLLAKLQYYENVL